MLCGGVGFWGDNGRLAGNRGQDLDGLHKNDFPVIGGDDDRFNLMYARIAK